MVKVSIRLQNHGKKNHPLWWIVVAPKKQNIKGRFIEHVGYWSPRQGQKYLERQIVLNLPRVKYWIANGAVPTFKVHKFLSLWGLLPKPWYFQKTEEQREAQKTPYEQLDDKKKRKRDRKEKHNQRLRQQRGLDPINWNKKYSRYHFYKGFKQKYNELIRISERQNQILREMLLIQDVQKAKRMQQLSKQNMDMDKNYANLKEKLQKAKSQLKFFEDNYKNTHHIQKVKAMQVINQLSYEIRSVQLKRINFILPERPIVLGGQGNQNVTQSYMRKLAQYELITKKIQRMYDQMDKFSQITRPITLEEYAQFLKRDGIKASQSLQLAEQVFFDRVTDGSPITLLEIMVQKDDDPYRELFDSFYSGNQQPDELDEAEISRLFLGKQDRNLNMEAMFQKSIDHTQNSWFPTTRPVNPFPDFKTYIPSDYYEPIGQYDLQTTKFDPMESYQQLQKYYLKTGQKNKHPLQKQPNRGQQPDFFKQFKPQLGYEKSKTDSYFFSSKVQKQD